MTVAVPGITTPNTPKRQSSFEIVTVNFNPASVAINTTAEQTITVPGVAVGDVVFVNRQRHDAGLGIVGARVSAANTVSVVFSNNTGTAIDAVASDFTFLIMRQAQVSDSFNG
jgi:hypothetical protein